MARRLVSAGRVRVIGLRITRKLTEGPFRMLRSSRKNRGQVALGRGRRPSAQREGVPLVAVLVFVLEIRHRKPAPTGGYHEHDRALAWMRNGDHALDVRIAGGAGGRSSSRDVDDPAWRDAADRHLESRHGVGSE